MQRPGKTKKSFAGGTARRAFLICLAVLILPLFIHSFILYAREIRIEEQNVRADLRAIGSTMAQKISEIIHIDWKLLELKNVPWASLAAKFHVEKIAPQEGAGSHFAFVNEQRNSLFAGIQNSSIEAHAIVHSLPDLLTIPSPPFPIDTELGKKLDTIDQWVEKFSLSDTNLTLSLGTSSQRIGELQKSRIIFRIASFLVVIGVIGGGIVYLLLRKLSRPLNTLRLTMERVAEGAIHSRYAPQRWGFEINAIGQYLNETLDALLVHQKQAEAERIKREKLAQELKLGHDIQSGLLPRDFPQLQNLDIGAACVQATEVGGDFYDVFLLSSGKVLIAVADLAGKGISACLFSIGLRSSLRALAETTDNLSELLMKANDLFLVDAGDTGEFATLWLGILNGKNLYYATMGHPPAFLKRGGILQELSTHHPAMGLMKFSSLQTNPVHLEEGDELLFYTDGATEAVDAEGKLFGIARLKETFLQCDEETAAQSAEKILEEIQRYGQGIPEQDDLTLLFIHVF